MKRGIVFGAFDLLHAGHLSLLKNAKQKCDELTVGIHVNPSIERPKKNKPIESIFERIIKLKSCKWVDALLVYETEAELELILQTGEYDVRFLGEDYAKVNPDEPSRITVEKLVPIEYINSLPIHTSDIRERIKKAK